MVQEIAVDRNLCAIDRKRGDAQPVGIDVTGRARPGARLRRNTMSVTTAVPSPFERIRRQTNSSQEIGLFGQIFADCGILLVERVMRRDQCQDASGLQRIDGLGEEEIVQ